MNSRRSNLSKKIANRAPDAWPYEAEKLEPFKRLPRDPQKRKTFEESRNHIYSASGLETLLRRITEPYEDGDLIFSELEAESPPSVKAVRYLLTTNGELRYGFEGTPSREVTPHEFMSHDGQCFAAGVLMVDFATHKVLAINNKSGDFEPSPASMLFALSRMIKDGVVFGGTLRIIQTSGGGEDCKIDVSFEKP